MPRKLQIWNGRGDYADLDGHIFVCATTKAEAVRLVNKAGYSAGRFNLRELNTYFHEGCWGCDMNGITPEPGVWFQSEKHAHGGCDCYPVLTFDKAHRDDCPRKPRRLV